MSNYAEFGLTVQGGERSVAQALRWLEEQAAQGQIEIVRKGRHWQSGGRFYDHIVVRLVDGQLDLLRSAPAPDNYSAVLGRGKG